MNISATLNVLRLLTNPQLCVPHLTIPSFDKIPIPLCFPSSITTAQPEIKAIVLDKDNCFAKDHDDKVWPEYQETFTKLRTQYPGASLLIVSNSAGTNDDINHSQAKILEESTGVTVLRHSTKKPGCHHEIMEYFKTNNICHKPEEVAVVGDRLFTDVLMANMMGSWSVWISNGVVRSESLICRMERELNNRMTNTENPYTPLIPGSTTDKN
ncbi:hypothetical protein WICPIJ_002916 [Wickerhamomyces pijperi]|uniref:Phosphatidylglycerophosphatase GEP4, mitochondrial n=1 Tax=Wickerhamomyces pijperi TaxID=599730 RepID=A0A9P8QAU3_WICPI|nr:hypothetical protein WICPIJ_002916 [Wickerhamomyces pijperi]